ncbi:MAG: Glutathione transport system permease protein GsiD [candidate division WS2 bacterium]|nr:Glutathione transport system permease protein GsiD [Candidatus Lithacetigena glycinireducens]
MIILMTSFSFAGPLFWKVRPSYIPLNPSSFLSPGSPGHPLGTDALGRDILARLMFGGKVSISVGFLSTAISIILGVAIGLAAGYYGGLIDNLLMRFTDVFLTIPTLPLLMSLAVVFRRITPILETRLRLGIFAGILPIVVVMAFLGWMVTARLVRGQVLSLREQQFIEASKAIGAQDSTVMWRHLLPNVMAPIIVSATLSIGGNMVWEASLSFLGLGVAPPATSWGQMLQGATIWALLPSYWYLILLPGFALFFTVLSFNFVGDGLRDAP